MSKIFISDGTTTVHFANDGAKGRFGYTAFTPQIAQAKEGGVWQDSPVADGRRLLSVYYQNIVDAISFNVRPLPADTGPDDVEADINELIDLVRQAHLYWTGAPDVDMVYIGHQGKGETETRYAAVHFAELPELGDINSIEWAQLYMLDLQLVVEHGHWEKQIPGNSTAVAIASGEDYNSVAHGWQTPTTAEIVHVANHRRVANITHIFRYDGAYSSNLVNSTAFDLFPSPLSINDELRICCSSAVADAGGVVNLVLDIGVTSGAFDSFDWSYYNGSSWAGVSSGGQGSQFKVAGIVEVYLRPGSSTWGTGTFNGVTGYWIAARVAQAGTGTIPTQQNRIITSAVMNHVEVAAAQVAGQLPALFTIETLGGAFNRALVCRRLTSRGSGFTPWINLRVSGNDQNQAGITVAVGTGVFAQEDTTEWPYAVAGASVGTDSTDATASAFANVAKVTLGSTIAQDYNGYFRLVLTGRPTADPASTLFARVRVKVGGDMRSYIAPLPSNVTDMGALVYLWDVGSVFIDTAAVGAASTSQVEIFIDATHENGVGLHFYSLGIMPIDEWAAEISLPLDQIEADYTTPSTSVSFVGDGEKIVASSILDRKRGLAAAERIDSNSALVQRGVVRATGPGALAPGETQRFYFLLWRAQIDASGVTAYNVYQYQQLTRVTIDKAERVLGSRGGV